MGFQGFPKRSGNLQDFARTSQGGIHFQDLLRASQVGPKGGSRTLHDLPPAVKTRHNLPTPSEDYPPRGVQMTSNTVQRRSRASKDFDGPPEAGLPRAFQHPPRASKEGRAPPPPPRGLPNVCQTLCKCFAGPSTGFQPPSNDFHRRPRVPTAPRNTETGFSRYPRAPSPPPRAVGRPLLPTSKPRASHPGTATLRRSERVSEGSAVRAFPA